MSCGHSSARPGVFYGVIRGSDLMDQQGRKTLHPQDCVAGSSVPERSSAGAGSNGRPGLAGTCRLKNFEDIGRAFADWHGRVEQVSTGRFEGSLRIVDTGCLCVVEASGTQRLRIVGRDGSGMLAIYPIVPGMVASMWKGHSAECGTIVVGGRDDETDITSERRYSGRAVFLQPEALEAASRMLLGPCDGDLASDSTVVAPTASAFDALGNEMSRLLKICLGAPQILGTPEGCLLEQECIRVLVSSLSSSAAVRLSASSTSRMVLRAKEFLRSHLREPVGVIDLCRETGASDRTLRHAFHERFGVGPMTYFRYLRLNAVRSRIRSDSQITIADAAREFGFHHLGNFAADYRRLFAIRPSETER